MDSLTTRGRLAAALAVAVPSLLVAVIGARAMGAWLTAGAVRAGKLRGNERPDRVPDRVPTQREAGDAGDAAPSEGAPPPLAGPGLTVSADGRLLRNGRVYRGIGVNYCDLFQTLIRDGNDERTLRGLRFLSKKRIPFVRFWCSGFWPADWDLYFENKDEWFRRLDLVVRTAEAKGMGLVPSLFWRTATYPDLFDEYNNAWGDPASRTRELMRTYVREVVTRYRASRAIWGWEFANELNLSCDLPNGMKHLGRKVPRLKVDVERDERNLMTYEIAGSAWSAFAREVRKHDARRFVTTGNSRPREHSYHNAVEKSWKHDGAGEAFVAFTWMNPAPMDVVSVHFYAGKAKEHRYAGATGVRAVLAKYKEFAKRLGKPLFLGEFAASAADRGEEMTVEEFRRLQESILEAIVEEEIDLAAYWVFDYTADRKGLGLVRKGNEWEFVLDRIAECNERIKAKLEEERGRR